MDESKAANRLVNEKSPYLLQHAYNPVDWFPWGNEAFEKAEREDKPILLSVGYSTCHWCHVMERESFEDRDAADTINRSFVPVKVDREERPDVDAFAMSACQAMTGNGGWPTTVFMTPDRQPFYAGTYFPRESMGGRIGLIELCEQIVRLWRDDRERLMEGGRRLVEHLRKTAGTAPAGIGEQTVRDALRELSDSFDPQWGGFGGPPKFPTPHILLFLLRCHRALRDGNALRMAEKTLDAMARGGIFDHVGGGFARYGTDRRWLVPHFEKMLYDNALLALAYCEAYAATGKTLFKETAERVFAYVLRDMTGEGGAFHTAEDADSEGSEGKYYVWPYEELRRLLSPAEFKLFSTYYPISREGNFEGGNIISRIGAPELPETGTPERDALDGIVRNLLAVRQKRERPFRDTKILSGWNGLMIAALAYGSRMLERADYTVAAVRAAGFVWDRMTDAGGRLHTRWRDGETSPECFQSDNAFFIWGLLELFEATADPIHLRRTLALADVMIRDFRDEQDGGFFLADARDGRLPIRAKETYDGALPSGNSTAAMDLVRLSRITGDPRWEDRARAVFCSMGGEAGRRPSAHAHLLSAWLTADAPSRQLTLAGRRGDRAVSEALTAARRKYLPFDTVLSWDADPALCELIPELKAYPVRGEPEAYLCRDRVCGQPTRDLMAAVAQLD